MHHVAKVARESIWTRAAVHVVTFLTGATVEAMDYVTSDMDFTEMAAVAEWTFAAKVFNLRQ